jgi:hypothetical protein
VAGLAEWLSAFRELHEKARRGSLGHGEANTYRVGRDELGRALLAAQRLTLKPGETPRQALRVARALQIDLDLPSGRQRAFTLDISTGGFSAQVPAAPALGHQLGLTLRLPAAEPLTCQARVTDVRPEGSQVRVAARFLALSPAERERLEMFVLDAALAQLTS